MVDFLKGLAGLKGVIKVAGTRRLSLVALLAILLTFMISFIELPIFLTAALISMVFLIMLILMLVLVRSEIKPKDPDSSPPSDGTVKFLRFLAERDPQLLADWVLHEKLEHP